MLSRGDTFLTGDEQDDTLHLWIILTPPSEGEVVTVSVTTKRRRSETLVELHPGDHPFIVHDSVIAYSYSRIRTVEEIEVAVASGTAKLREPISPKILERVCNGLLDSDFTPNGIRNFYKNTLESNR
jgi:mRNA-degrading endonuclease toxin of MazEF toxin-antitoxin module